jgi:hypothetical protein
MRCLLTIFASLAALALSACGESERPTLLSGALYHGFTLVDLKEGCAVPNAWAVLADGRVVHQGEGAPPAGDFIAKVDLSGARVVIGDRGEIRASDDHALTDWLAARQVAFVESDGMPDAADPRRRPFGGGEQTSSPKTN